MLAHPDGSLTWVTPTGHRHTSEPYDYRSYTDLPATDDAVTTSDAVTPDDSTAGSTDSSPADGSGDPPPF